MTNVIKQAQSTHASCALLSATLDADHWHYNALIQHRLLDESPSKSPKWYGPRPCIARLVCLTDECACLLYAGAALPSFTKSGRRCLFAV